MTSDEDREELFAIENRKRVKQQLEKMDETFLEHPVDFSYTIKSTGEKVAVETLEVLEHGIPEQSVSTENFQKEDGSIKVPTVLQKYLGKEVIS